MGEKTYTTTEISRICDVYPATVIHWIDSGKLRAYVTPGGHRRVTRDDLVDFLKKFQIPIPQELFSGKKTVLIVDDDAEMVRLLERAFAKHKNLFATQSVANGIEALVQIGQKPPNLMILDIVMPKMNGLEVCLKLRSMPHTSSIKIIAITGKKFVMEKSLSEYGIHALLKKPFSLKEAVKLAAKLLRLSLLSSRRESLAT